VSGAGTGAPGTRGHTRDAAPNERAHSAENVPRATSTSDLILTAGDEEPIAQAMSFIVEDAGHTPMIATNGRQALELARAHQPLLIITDLMMPHLDGTQLIKAIHADAELDGHAPPPILLMTAAGMKRAQEAGADAVMRKPFNIDALEAMIHRLVEGRSR
jgi:CheY-like chemotaxis protein